MIEELALLPEYRGLGLGKKLIERFSTGCSLVVLKAWPMQFRENKVYSNDEKEWLSRLRLEELERDKDKEIATSRLYLWLHSLNFTQPFQKEFFFMNTAVKNSKLDKISLE